MKVFADDKINLYTLPKDKILDESKLKVFADNKIKVAKIKTFVFDRVENTVEKEENVGYQQFLLFPRCFQRTFYSGSLKAWIVW